MIRENLEYNVIVQYIFYILIFIQCVTDSACIEWSFFTPQEWNFYIIKVFSPNFGFQKIYLAGIAFMSLEEILKISKIILHIEEISVLCVCVCVNIHTTEKESLFIEKFVLDCNLYRLKFPSLQWLTSSLF